MKVLSEMTRWNFPDFTVWYVEFNIMCPADIMVCKGNGIRMEKKADIISIFVELPYITHCILKIDSSYTRIFTFPGSKVPIFARIKDGKVRMSNVACLLIDEGEEIKLSMYVVVQQIRGSNFPQANIFLDIKLLEASSTYLVTAKGINYEATTLKPIVNVRKQDTDAYLMNAFDTYFKDGAPIAILLSGGYDSRLNLAFALHYSRKYNNQVFAYHEFKNEKEYEIAEQVAKKAKVPFVSKSRDFFAGEIKELIFNPEFILFHSGTYRDNLPRWYGYLRWIKSALPSCVIIGFGAEAHKGKYYNQIRNLRRDSEKILGISDNAAGKTAYTMGFYDYDKTKQRTFFDELCNHAQVYDNLYSKIDFLHYHTYIANGYGQRSHDLIQKFSMPFPFLDDGFLQTVFSLDCKEKINFKLVENGIFELAPSLLDIPFVSGNIKALKRKTAASRFARSVAGRLRRHTYRSSSPRVRGEFLTLSDIKRIYEADFGSKITMVLRDVILNECKKTTGIRLIYATQMFLYLRQIEKELSVKFRCA